MSNTTLENTKLVLNILWFLMKLLALMICSAVAEQVWGYKADMFFMVGLVLFAAISHSTITAEALYVKIPHEDLMLSQQNVKFRTAVVTWLFSVIGASRTITSLAAEPKSWTHAAVGIAVAAASIVWVRSVIRRAAPASVTP